MGDKALGVDGTKHKKKKKKDKKSKKSKKEKVEKRGEKRAREESVGVPESEHLEKKRKTKPPQASTPSASEEGQTSSDKSSDKSRDKSTDKTAESKGEPGSNRKDRKQPYDWQDGAVSTDFWARKWTVSVALPSSVLNNVQTARLRTYVAGQIARALGVFNVDEVVIFNETARSSDHSEEFGAPTAPRHVRTRDDAPQPMRDFSVFFCRLLAYLECPQYLRKALFPVHKELQYAGLMNPLDALHHYRTEHNVPFREGVVYYMEDPPRPPEHLADTEVVNEYSQSQWVDVGLQTPVCMPTPLPTGIRVTVSMWPAVVHTSCSSSSQSPDWEGFQEDESRRRGGRVMRMLRQRWASFRTEGKSLPSVPFTPVSPATPRETLGLYTGYAVRSCDSLSKVFSECPFGRYDVTVGTSERGDDIFDEDTVKTLRREMRHPSRRKKGSGKGFRHLLLVLGGVAGLEACVLGDDECMVTNPRDLFDVYLNVCPNQGSRTIRTEEALPIALAALNPLITENWTHAM